MGQQRSFGEQRHHRRQVGAVVVLWAACTLALAVATPSGAEVVGSGAPLSGVTVQYDLPYRTASAWDGSEVTLTLDLYRPSDPASIRGGFVWIHGGGFTGGSPRDTADVEIATFLAEHGIVTASIHYRLGPDVADPSNLSDPVVLGRIVRAYEDGRAAVEFTRSHAGVWGFDPSVLYVGGASAGAATALNVGYLGDHNTDPSAPTAVSGVISLVGRTLPQLIQPGEPEMLMVNGTDDPIVPIADARATCEAALAAGVGCEFHALDMGHGDTEHIPEVEALMLAWLDARIPPAAQPPTTTVPTTGAGAPPPQPATETATTSPSRPVGPRFAG